MAGLPPCARAGLRGLFLRAIAFVPLMAGLGFSPMPELDARMLAERHFTQLQGFDSMEAYRASKGQGAASFVVVRRWSKGHAQVLVDMRAPAPFRRWDVLMLAQAARSDDVFIYVPNMRRVRRLSPLFLQYPIFDFITLDDLRPIAPGELVYERIGEESVEGKTCALIEGRPVNGTMAFDRIELAIEPESGFSLRTRYFRSGHEQRRVEISPDDLKSIGGRLLPRVRRIYVNGGAEPTAVTLQNAVIDPSLPASLFTKHTLRSERFPKF